MNNELVLERLSLIYCGVKHENGEFSKVLTTYYAPDTPMQQSILTSHLAR